MQMQMDMRLAVLIDADNVPHDRITGMMKEIARYGTPTIKRIYGDWTKPDLKGWKNILLSHAITPIQQYRYTVGKNSTDSAMIIEAMDMLYAGNVDGFFIVSSDSDFTRLALRLRESGKRVFGMGERKTPKPFIVACDKFTYIEIIELTKANSETANFQDDLDLHPAKTELAGSKTDARHKKPDLITAKAEANTAKPDALQGKLEPISSKSTPMSSKQDISQLRKDQTQARKTVANKVLLPKSAASQLSVTAATETQTLQKERADSGHSREIAPDSGRSVEQASSQEHDKVLQEGKSAVHERSQSPVETVTQEIVELIASSITDLADENGWAFLGDVGTLIAKKKTDFDPRNYGFIKLTPLIRSLDVFELDIRETSQYHIKHVYVRNRR